MKKWIMVIGIMTLCFLAFHTEEVDATTNNSTVEFTITEKMMLEGDGTGCELVAEPGAIEIVNEGNRDIVVETIRAEGSNGWTLVGGDCEFDRLAANSRKINVMARDVMAGNEHDLISPYHINKTLSSGGYVTIPISAKTGPVTEAVSDEHVLSLITTITTPEINLYEYPVVDFLAAEETFDHSVFDYGITRTIAGASSIKLVFDREIYIYTTGEEHSLVVMDGDFKTPYDGDVQCDEMIVPGDTATIWVDILAPTGRGNKDLDIRTIEWLDVVVTFIPLDENGNELQMTDESIVYDEDMNIVPLVPLKKGGDDAQ